MTFETEWEIYRMNRKYIFGIFFPINGWHLSHCRRSQFITWIKIIRMYNRSIFCHTQFDKFK